MNPIPALNEAFCIRLAETLLHFLWQGTLIAFVALAFGSMLRRAAAQARYWAYVAALALMAASPVVTFWLLAPLRTAAPVPVRAAARPDSRPAAQAPVAGLAGSPASPRPMAGESKPLLEGQILPAESAAPPLPRPALIGQQAWARRLDWQRLAPAVVALYMTGVLLMLGRLFLAVRGGNALRRRSREVDDPALRRALSRAVAALRLRTAPALAWCGEVAVPTVVGILKPTVLLPLTLASGLAPEQVELLLLHELAHLRRRDHWINMAQWLVETALFFHPAVWVVSRRIRVERELSCDDMVLATGVERDNYADSLLRMAEISRGLDRLAPNTALALGAATRRSKLGQRILRLIEGEGHEAVRIGRAWPLGVLALVLALVMLAPRLEVKAGRESKEKAGTDKQTNTLIEQVREGFKKQNFRNLYLEAESRWEDWDTTRGQWVPTEVLIATRSWYEDLARGRKRIEFDPERLKWEHGAAPYCETRFLIAETNERFFKINHIYSQRDHTYESHIAENKRKHGALVKSIGELAWSVAHKGQEMPKGISEEQFDYEGIETGVGLLPGGTIKEGHMARLEEALEAIQKRPNFPVKAREVTENGRRLIQVEAGGPEVLDLYVFKLDPEKGYALASSERTHFDYRTKAPSPRSRIQVTDYQQAPSGGWVPIAWTSETPGRGRRIYRASFIGNFDPKTADAIFEAKDVVLNKPAPNAPRGPHPASGVAIAKSATDEKVNPNVNSRATAAMQPLALGYDPFTSRSATQALNKAYDPITSEPATKSVRIVASKDRLTFQGREVPLSQLPELLRAVPDRIHTVLEIAETMDVIVSSNRRDYSFYSMAHNQALRLTRELGFHHCEQAHGALGTMGSARYDGEFTPGREMPVRALTGTLDAPELLQTEWLRIDPGKDTLKARLHGTILSSPNTRWMATLELFDERGILRVMSFATLENSGKRAGGVTRDAFDLEFPTDSAKTHYYHDGYDEQHRLPLSEERQRALGSAGRLVRCKLVISEIGFPVDAVSERTVNSTIKVTSQSAADRMMKNPAAPPARRDAPTSATKAGNPGNTRTIALPIKDQAGKPVTGAEVLLIHHVVTEKLKEKKEVFGPVAADARGIATFTGIPTTGTLVAYARVPGKLIGVALDFYPPPPGMKPKPFEVTMVPSTNIGGKVTAPAGYDLARITVRVMTYRIRDGKSPYGAGGYHGDLEMLPWSCMTDLDENGRYTLADLPKEGMIYLAAEGRGLGQGQVMTGQESGPNGFDMTLGPEGIIEGDVRDAAGKPVTGASVYGTPYLGNVTLPFITATDAAGHYALKGLRPEKYTVQVAVPESLGDLTATPVGNVFIKAGQRVTGIDFKLGPGARVHGTVKDSRTGKPLAKAQINAMSPGMFGAGVGSAATDQDGRYTLRIPEGSAHLYISACPEGYTYPKDSNGMRAPTEENGRKVTVKNGEEIRTGADFVLDPQGPEDKIRTTRAQGRVLAPDGKPLAGIVVRSDVKYPDGRQEQGDDLGKTGANGRYDVEVVVGGVYRLFAGGEDWGYEFSKEFTARDKTMQQVEDLKLLPVSAFIEGRVLDIDGKPILGARVDVASKHNWNRVKMTDAAGRFRVDKLVDEPLSIYVVQSGKQNLSQSDLAPGRNDYVFIYSSIPWEKKLTAEEAARLAATAANLECEKRFQKRPFTPQDYPAQMKKTSWAWGRLDQPNKAGFAAEVFFFDSGNGLTVNLKPPSATKSTTSTTAVHEVLIPVRDYEGLHALVVRGLRQPVEPLEQGRLARRMAVQLQRSRFRDEGMRREIIPLKPSSLQTFFASLAD